MPKVSKVPVPGASTRVEPYKPKTEALDKYQCSRCGSTFKRLRANFPGSQSMLYKGNGGFLPVCNHCIEELYQHYKERLGDKEAIRRLCMKFDIYWSNELYDMISKANTINSRIKPYISRANLIQFTGKTYDDTLDEESAAISMAARPTIQIVSDSSDQSELAETIEVSKEVMDFWGAGFSPEVYCELESRYKKWTEDVPKPVESGAEALYRQICILEVTITRNAIAGKPIESTVNTLNTLIGSVNAKPVQRKQDEQVDGAFDSSPFGVGIKMLENIRPVSDPLPELADVDGVVKYITTWLLGHLCKMLGIKNRYCKLYEDEIARIRVDRPELAEEDDEDLFNDIFGGAQT